MRHIQYALLDARRDLADQLTRRRSHWGRLTSDLAVPAQDVAALEQALDETARRIVASSPTLTAVEGELAGVREALGSAISSVAITPLPSQLEEIARRADVVVGAPDAVPLPLRMQGLGARSLAAATVFRALTKSVVGGGASTSALSVTGLEEPEAHLHPQAHRAMFEIIISLPGQKVLSTHSPYVARVAGVHDIRVFRRNATGVHVRFVPKLKADGNPTFTDEERAKIERFFQRHHSEALFSRVTILYEGETEHVAMPVFARHFLGIDPSVEGMTLISLEGVANLGHIAPALDALGINWCVMVDGDQAARDALATASNKMSRVLDSTSPEVVMLDSVDYETHLVDCGYRPEIEHYIATRHGGTALATYRNAHHGQNNRDYQSDGWEGRLLVDYMRSHCKGAEARHIATAIVASDRTHAVIPTGIGDLLTRGSQVAGVAQ